MFMVVVDMGSLPWQSLPSLSGDPFPGILRPALAQDVSPPRQPMDTAMKPQTPALLAAALLTACAAMSPAPPGMSLDQAIAADSRTPANVARDPYRHPKQTLEFFGLKPEMTVVEVWPSRGWYTEILAPYIRGRGHYYAAGFAISNPDAPKYQRDITADFAAMLAGRPDLYSRVVISELGKPDYWAACPPGTADLVLTFRNVHNWLAGGYENEMFKAFYTALKPGGVLGVVEHRAKPGASF